MTKNPIYCAIDTSNIDDAINIINQISPYVGGIKLGLEFFTSCGIKGVEKISKFELPLFLDLKLYDIPNTVKKSIEGLISLPVSMLTIHASGGKEMMMAAMEAVSKVDIKVFGVTALTSLSNEDTNEIFQRSTSEQVETMLDLAESAGIHGVVCSPHELKLVNQRESLLSITPGIRLEDSIDDQKRVMTPKEAITSGADYLVIGRPITESKDIKKSLNEIYQSLR